MKCPYCNIGINLKVDDEKTYRIQSETANETGIKIINSFCPQCNELIVLLEKGECRWIDDSAELSTVTHKEIIYPKFVLRVSAGEVPSNYRDIFNESNSVLSASPKASAALSRRLLQQILRDEFKIHKKDLSLEIDEFLQRSDIPSEIKDSLDAIRNVGNFAAHPQKYQNTGAIAEVEIGEASWLLDVLEALFDVTFIQPALTKSRRDNLNSKLQALGKPLMK